MTQAETLDRLLQLYAALRRTKKGSAEYQRLTREIRVLAEQYDRMDSKDGGHDRP